MKPGVWLSGDETFRSKKFGAQEHWPPGLTLSPVTGCVTLYQSLPLSALQWLVSDSFPQLCTQGPITRGQHHSFGIEKILPSSPSPLFFIDYYGSSLGPQTNPDQPDYPKVIN